MKGRKITETKGTKAFDKNYTNLVEKSPSLSIFLFMSVCLYKHLPICVAVCN